MKHRLSYILFLLSAIYTFGQVTLIPAVEDKDYKINQRFTVTFILRIDGNDFIQETPLRLPDFSKFNVVGSASDQNSYIDPIKKIVINQTVFQWVLEPKQAGKLRIGSALVNVNGKTYKTEPIDIFVKDADKKSDIANVDNSRDVYLNLELKKDEVYENQSVMAVLRVYSKNFDNFRKVQNINFPQQSNLNIRPVSFAKSEIEVPNDKSSFASQVVAVFMIFPNSSGKIEISPAFASLKTSNKSEKISSNKVKINVKTLPNGSPSNYKNAVGNFNVSVDKNSVNEVVEVNKPLEVIVKVSGEGNLNGIHIPKILPSADYTFYKPNISTKTTPGKQGISGQVFAHYVIVPKKSGNIDIKTEEFSYFNPSQKKYVDLGSKVLALNVMTSQEISDAKSTLEKVNDYTNTVLETVNTPVLKTTDLKIKEKNKINWSIVLLNFAIVSGLVSGFYFVRKVKKRIVPGNSTQEQKPLGSVAETEAEIRQNLKPDFETNFVYLDNLIKQENHQHFFDAYSSFESDVENFFTKDSAITLKKYIETSKGNQLAEEFTRLQQKIQMEKYAPEHTCEHMKELSAEIRQVYSQIE